VDVIRYPGDVRPRHWKAAVLAIGNFDGLHLGHMAIVDRVRSTALERGATPVVLTFDPHPTRVLRPDKAPPILMTEAQKIEALQAAGIQGVAIVRFTADMSRWEPETFVRMVLAEWLGVAAVWVGAGFLFGRDRSGTFDVLRMLGGKYGFEAEKIEPVCVEGSAVSSTRIRRLIAEGHVDRAGALLGRHYSIEGEVVGGDGRGRLLGFPTANLRSENALVPPHGVYAALAEVGSALHPAVTSIGSRPTFAPAGEPTIETHLLRVSTDLYGRHLRLFFVKRLRDERAFESVDALSRQIEQDCLDAEALVGQVSV
jgi:riboflavin kinase / FMN adenylyltransferase